ncbi:MAG: hypothetical protein ACERKN_15060 [Velocimicrobium sp.]
MLMSSSQLIDSETSIKFIPIDKHGLEVEFRKYDAESDKLKTVNTYYVPRNRFVDIINTMIEIEREIVV